MVGNQLKLMFGHFSSNLTEVGAREMRISCCILSWLQIIFFIFALKSVFAKLVNPYCFVKVQACKTQ